MSARTLTRRLDRVADRLHSSDSYVELDDGSQVYVGRFGAIAAALGVFLGDRDLTYEESGIYSRMVVRPERDGSRSLMYTLRDEARKRLGLSGDA